MKGVIVESKLHSTIFFSLLFAISFFANSIIFAQGDNPNIDALPLEYLQNINYSDNPLFVITTADGFDNFNLGVDFAEPHMSQNPNDPLQYFNAFNTNGTWRTYDGHDWTHSFPGFGTTMRGDPVTAYDGEGRLFYENMYGSPNVLGCKVIVSTDNGATWSAPVTAISGFDKNWIAADQTSGPYANYVYTILTRNSTGQNLARSTDHGVTWTQ